MDRPKSYSENEWRDLTWLKQDENNAQWSAYWLTPEGIAEKAELESKRRVAYVAALPEAIADWLRQRNSPPFGPYFPPRALEAVLGGDLQATPALTAVREFSGGILVLSGSAGTGKTLAAVAGVHAYVSDPSMWTPGNKNVPKFVGTMPVWISAGQLARVDHFKQQDVDHVAKAEFLVIDDLGAEFQDAKGFFGSLLDEVIDSRYSSMRPTVITTNLDTDGFKSRYGVRIVDRIREAGLFVKCGATSLRKPTPAKPRSPSVGNYPCPTGQPLRFGRLEMP
jgi:hypothetical protein